MERCGFNKPSPSFVVSVIALVFAMTATGFAAKELLGSKDIENNSLRSKDVKDNSLKSKDLKNGQLTEEDLDEALAAKVNGAGTPGADGAPGAPGAPGTPGIPGTATFSSEDWGVIERNSFGSPYADYRSGPLGFDANVGGLTAGPPTLSPPLGAGSLSLRVDDTETGDATNNSADSVSFGTETAFYGDLVSDIDELSYDVYFGDATTVLPSIKIEIDSDLTGADDYSTLSFVAANPAPGDRAQWKTVDATDGTAGFFLSGVPEQAASGCAPNTPCTFAALQAALPDTARVYTAAVGVGRGGAFVGAVDAFRIGDEVVDFELTGAYTSTL